MLQYPIVVYEERKYCVYAHINKSNWKTYIGMTGQKPEARWSSGHGYDNCTVFHRAIEKYGWDNFIHIVLMNGLTKSEAYLFERLYIKILRTRDGEFGYNCTDGGEGSTGIKPATFVDLTGQQFGRLFVMYRNGTHVSPAGVKRTIWHCVCQCDKHTEMDVSYSDLMYGNTKSCGCLNAERIRQKHPNQYQISEDNEYMIGITKSGYEYIIDIDDYEKVSSYTWSINHNKFWDSNNLVAYVDTDGTRKTVRILNVILDLPPTTKINYKVIYKNGNNNDFRKNNIEIIIPNSVDPSEYMEHLKSGGLMKLYFHNGYCKVHSDSGYRFFKHRNDAVKYWHEIYDDNPPSIHNKTMKIICLNSLEVFDSTGQATKYTDVKRIAISHSCNGRNKYGGRHLVTGEKLKWMKLSDYEKLSDDEKENLRSQYYTGSLLVCKEEPV